MRDKLSNHPKVKEFLDRVCGEVMENRRKIEIREELLSHLESDLAEMDLLTDAAISESLRKFGDPIRLGRSFRRAHQTWQQKLARLSGWGVVCGFGLLYLLSMHFISFYEQKLNTLGVKLDSKLSRFQSGQLELANYDFLRESSQGKADAGIYLNEKIGKGEFDILKMTGSTWSGQWLKERVPMSLENADLSWIAELSKYDHWDFFAHGPNQKFVGDSAILVNPYVIQIPDLSLLTLAAKLRLRRGLDQNNVVPALSECRHLARLAYTSETLVGSMISVALLKIERAAYDEGLKRRLFTPYEYQAFEPETLATMKNTLWATIGFADFSTPQLARRIFLGKHWPVGSCAALAETAQAFVLAESYLEQKYPLEKDMSSRTALVKDLFVASKAHCRLTFSRQLLDRKLEYAKTMLTAESFSLASGWQGLFENYRILYGRHLPFLRQAIGLELVTIARPDFTAVYDHN